jgi:hypothetical protein
MGDDDERAFALVEIGDLNAVGLEALQGHRPFLNRNHSLPSLPGTRVWLRQPEHKLDDPGNPVTPALIEHRDQ